MDGTAATDDDVADMLLLNAWEMTPVLNNTGVLGLTLLDCDVVDVADESGIRSEYELPDYRYVPR